MLHLSAWAVLQHAGIGILLGTAIVMGNRVEGGVVAYQFAFVAFMAAYSILAQPVHTTILPDMSLDANRGATADVRRTAFAGHSTGWGSSSCRCRRRTSRCRYRR